MQYVCICLYEQAHTLSIAIAIYRRANTVSVKSQTEKLDYPSLTMEKSSPCIKFGKLNSISIDKLLYGSRRSKLFRPHGSVSSNCSVRKTPPPLAIDGVNEFVLSRSFESANWLYPRIMEYSDLGYFLY